MAAIVGALFGEDIPGYIHVSQRLGYCPVGCHIGVGQQRAGTLVADIEGLFCRRPESGKQSLRGGISGLEGSLQGESAVEGWTAIGQ